MSRMVRKQIYIEPRQEDILPSDFAPATDRASHEKPGMTKRL